MKKKRVIRKEGWGFSGFPCYQMRVERDDFHGWAVLNELLDGEYVYWDFPKAGKTPVAGKGMCWLTLIPDGKKRSIITMFTTDGNVSAWYVDVIYSVQLEDDGVLSFMDQYLDVLLTPSGDVGIDDRDELDAAYAAGEFTKEDYDDALREGERIIEDMTRDIQETEMFYKEMLGYVREQVKKFDLRDMNADVKIS